MIELTDVSRPEIEHIKLRYRLMRLALYLGSAAGTALALMYWSSIAWGWLVVNVDVWRSATYNYLLSFLPAPQTEVQIIEAEDLTLDEIIGHVAEEFRLHPVILQAVADQESSYGQALYRFESDAYQARMKTDKNKSDGERRMMASSHGVMHVMGYNAARCNLHWSELYDPRKGVWCGAKILREELNGIKGKASVKLQAALSIYNSGRAGTEKGKAYADKVLSHMMQRKMSEISEGL